MTILYLKKIDIRIKEIHITRLILHTMNNMKS